MHVKHLEFLCQRYLHEGYERVGSRCMEHLTVLREQLNLKYRYTAQYEQHSVKHVSAGRQVGKCDPLTPHFQKS